MMYLLIILLSYLLGCASTIVLLVYLYMRYGLKSPVTINEHEQYQVFHPISEVSRYLLKSHVYVYISIRMFMEKIQLLMLLIIYFNFYFKKREILQN